MKSLIDTPYFGIVLSILVFEIGVYINKKTRIPLFNPLLIGIMLAMAVLLFFKIDFSYFNKGGNMISFFLGPATVVLAIPLYRQLDLLKKNLIPILAGVLAGSIACIISIIYMSKFFGLDRTVALALVPKSITTPIGIELSKQLGGVPSLTVGAILLSGITGAVIGPFVCRLLRIKDEVAVGIAIGTSSHAVGTTKAVELGEVQGSMSGLAIGIAGLITVIIAPILARLL